jgi:hypothetical protein
MLMESEHNMAREDKEDSGAEVEFITFFSIQIGLSDSGVRGFEKQAFSALASSKRIGDMLAVHSCRPSQHAQS